MKQKAKSKYKAPNQDTNWQSALYCEFLSQCFKDHVYKIKRAEFKFTYQLKKTCTQSAEVAMK